jgi:hypothetical protein
MPIPSCSSPWRIAAALLVVLLGTSSVDAAMCDVPSFSNVGGPLPLGDGDVDAHALVAGNFTSRPEERCDCDIAAATVDNDGHHLIVFRGRDDGTFDPVQRVALPGRPVAAARFGGSDDRDGIAVLQRLSDENSQLNFFVLDATGQVVEPIEARRLGAGVTALAMSDFNRDGNPDIAVGAALAPRLTLLMGMPGGGLEADGRVLDRFEPDVDHFVTGLAPGAFPDGDNSASLAVAVSNRAEQSVAFVGIDASDNPELLARTVVSPGNSLAIATTSSPNGPDVLMAVAEDAGSTTTGRLLRITPDDVEVVLVPDFDRPPKALAAADLNGDAFQDLVVSTYGSQAGSPDARIHLLRGEPNGGYTSMFFTPQRDLHARGLVVGTFGRDPFDERQRHTGIAALEDPPGSAMVYRGNGAGAFVRPTGFRTDLPHPDARIVVSADLHGADGESIVSDLGYVWWNEDRNRFMFSVLLSTGNRGFFDAGQAISVGKEPLLFAAGRFDADLITDLAVVDANPDDVRRRPLLKLFRGSGDGKFTTVPGVSEYPLGEGELPRGIVAGALDGGDGPMDIVVVSDSPAGGSVLTRLNNDGTGQFERRFDPLPLPFASGAIFASNRFREGQLDLVVRSNHDNSFMFLRNAGDGEIVSQDLIRDPDGTGIGAGGPPAGARRLFVADLNGDGFVDLVGIDEDKTIDTFMGDGDGGFQFDTSDAIKDEPFLIEDAQFFVDDFGAGRAGLAALVRRGLSPALLSLGADSAGRFLPPAELEMLEPPTGEQTLQTRFERRDISNPVEITAAPLDQAFAGRFANLEHGNGLPDIGAVMTAGRIEVVPGQCPGDDFPYPGDEKVCGVAGPGVPDEDAVCSKQCPPNQGCMGTCRFPVCQNPPCHGGGMCRTACDFEPSTECHFEVRHPYCAKTTGSLTYLIVFGNTCAG